MSLQPVAFAASLESVPVPYTNSPNGDPSGKPATSDRTALFAASMRTPGASSAAIEPEASSTITVGGATSSDAEPADDVPARDDAADGIRAPDADDDRLALTGGEPTVDPIDAEVLV